jgi:hypothetical protein
MLVADRGDEPNPTGLAARPRAKAVRSLSKRTVNPTNFRAVRRVKMSQHPTQEIA